MSDSAQALGFALTGLVLGVSGGLSPGPLTALVLSQTLRHGLREGLKVACAPVLTDGPLLILSALAVGALSGLDTLLGLIALVGSGFLLLLAKESWSAELPTAAESSNPRSVRTAVMTNLVNPHPYVFWVSIGGPLAHEAATTSTLAITGFLAGFFGGLTGSKAALAGALASVRHKVDGRRYTLAMRLLALALLGFAAAFAVEGLRRLGVF